MGLVAPRLLSIVIFIISLCLTWYHFLNGTPYIGFTVITIIALFQVKLCYGEDYKENE